MPNRNLGQERLVVLHQLYRDGFGLAALDNPERLNDLPVAWDDVIARPIEEPIKPVKRKSAKVTMDKLDPPKLGEIYGIKVIGANRNFGIEIEVEGKDLPQEILNWSAIRDGSLRGEALEYILKRPESFVDAYVALDNFQDAFKDVKVDLSFRTSVHVHVNMTNKTPQEINNFLYLAFLFEDALVNYSGKERKGNRFCLRMKDSFFKVDEFERFIKDLHVQPESVVKYSAINLAPLAIKGSIEFRSHRGTVNTELIKQWLSILNELLKSSLKYKTMLEIEEDLEKTSPLQLLMKVFPTNWELLNYLDLEEDVNYNHSLMIQLPRLID